MIDNDDGFFNDDDIVDAFPVDIQPSRVAAGGGMTEVISHTGIFEIANIELSFEVECLPGFAGESCVPVCSTDPCSNNGTCLQSVSGFTCACRGDFTGETCETRINDCQDVDCNDGTCVDGVLSFTCQCDPGFTGEFCEDGITTSVTTTTTTPDSTPDDATSTTSNPDDATSSNVDATLIGVVAGTAVGVVLLVAILITIICIICIKVPSGTSVLAVTISSFGLKVSLFRQIWHMVYSRCWHDILAASPYLCVVVQEKREFLKIFPPQRMWCMELQVSEECDHLC